MPRPSRSQISTPALLLFMAAFPARRQAGVYETIHTPFGFRQAARTIPLFASVVIGALMDGGEGLLPLAPERFERHENQKPRAAAEPGEIADQPELAVIPARQGLGLGRRLLAFAEAEALRRGYREIRLYTHQTMVENQRLYTSIGYEETGCGTEAGYDRVFMRKQLHG